MRMTGKTCGTRSSIWSGRTIDVLPDIYWVDVDTPGRVAVMPRPRGGDWLLDEVSAWRAASLGHVVCLLESAETRSLDLADEGRLCKKAGIQFTNFPIVDRGVPASVRGTLTLVDDLLDQINRGLAIAIHCRAGIGRTGLIAACLLVRGGVAPRSVFQILSAARGVPMPDTDEQTEWVHAFARSHGARRA